MRRYPPNRASRHVERTCAECGKKYVGEPSSRRCSSACRNARQRRQHEVRMSDEVFVTRRRDAGRRRYKRGEQHLYKLLRRYGLTPELFWQMFENQEGLCAICSCLMVPPALPGAEARRPNSVCVDHDHVTGKVRGLLCIRCNVGMGTLQDSTRLLHNAIGYLESAA